jgi:peroxiredoxin
MRAFFLQFIFLVFATHAGAGLLAQGKDSESRPGKLDFTCYTGAWARGASAGLVNSDNGAYLGPLIPIKGDSFKVVQQVPQSGIYLLAISKIPGNNNPVYFNIFLTNEKVVMHLPGQQQMPQVKEGLNAQGFQDLVAEFGQAFDKLSQINTQLQGAGTYNYSRDSLMTIRSGIAAQVGSQVPGYLQRHGNTLVAPFLLNIIWGLNYPLATMEVWAGQVSAEAMASNYGESLKELIAAERLTGYGQIAPVFTQNDPDGNPVSLSDFRGKYVLIDFWASWCGPCRIENPAVVQAYHRFKNQNFTILGVSLDKDRKKWLEAVEKDQLTWSQVSDLGSWNNAVAKLYRVSSIPQNFLLDPEGKIIGKNLRGSELSAFLQKVLPTN